MWWWEKDKDEGSTSFVTSLVTCDVALECCDVVGALEVGSEGVSSARSGEVEDSGVDEAGKRAWHWSGGCTNSCTFGRSNSRE